MPRIFEKPLEDITKEDIEELLGWPEGETTEFKKTLSGENGEDGSHGDNVTRDAKKAIFKEIVAFANTAGGHLFLGIEESGEKPPTAQSVKPLPRCVELAESLKRSAYSSIDPPIPGLNACGVVTEEDGSSGVVVFRVPQSRSAPHRSSDRHCYVRRGEESVPISMREIQDLTIHLSRRMDEIKARFDRAHDDFLKWLYPDGPDGAIGLRVTAVPVGASLYVDRVYPDIARKVLNIRAFQSTLSKPFFPFPLNPVRLVPSSLAAPMFRGARVELSISESVGGAISFSAYCDGVMDMASRMLSQTLDGRLSNEFSVAWILNHVANVVKAARAFAETAGVPECEYGVTLEITRLSNSDDWAVHFVDTPTGSAYLHASLLVEEPITLGDRDALMNRVLADIYDACHVRIAEPPTIKIDWDD